MLSPDRRSRLFAALVAAAALCSALPALAAQVKDVRVGVHPKFTRIVFELDGKAGYRVERAGTELRITIEATSSTRSLRASGDVRGVKIDAGTQARASIALRDSGLRVREMILSDPPRIVLDVVKPETEVAAATAPKPAPKPAAESKSAPKPVAEAKPSPSPAPKPAAETKPAPAPKPIAETKPSPSPAPKPIAEAKPSPSPAPKPPAEIKPAPEPKPIAEIKPSPSPAPKPSCSARAVAVRVIPAPRATEPPEAASRRVRIAPRRSPPAPTASPTPDDARSSRPRRRPRRSAVPPPRSPTPARRHRAAPQQVAPRHASPDAGQRSPHERSDLDRRIAAAVLSLGAIAVVMRRRRALPNDLDVTAIAEEVEQTSDDRASVRRIPSGGFAMGDDSRERARELVRRAVRSADRVCAARACTRTDTRATGSADRDARTRGQRGRGLPLRRCR
jgi:hypothetical protein